jgi:hypothetical protein
MLSEVLLWVLMWVLLKTAEVIQQAFVMRLVHLGLLLGLLQLLGHQVVALCAYLQVDLQCRQQCLLWCLQQY